MRVFVDTNVIIDVFDKREPFFSESYKIIQLGLEGQINTIMSAGAVTDVYYIVNKYVKDDIQVREKIFILGNFIKICNCTSEDITGALALFMPDFEDAVAAAIARREKADYIITRNEEDFANSPVPAISPAEFLSKFPVD